MSGGVWVWSSVGDDSLILTKGLRALPFFGCKLCRFHEVNSMKEHVESEAIFCACSIVQSTIKWKYMKQIDSSSQVVALLPDKTVRVFLAPLGEPDLDEEVTL